MDDINLMRPCIGLRHKAVSGLDAEVRNIDDGNRIIGPRDDARTFWAGAQDLGQPQHWKRALQPAQINYIFHAQDVARVG